MIERYLPRVPDLNWINPYDYDKKVSSSDWIHVVVSQLWTLNLCTYVNFFCFSFANEYMYCTCTNFCLLLNLFWTERFQGKVHCTCTCTFVYKRGISAHSYLLYFYFHFLLKTCSHTHISVCIEKVDLNTCIPRIHNVHCTCIVEYHIFSVYFEKIDLNTLGISRIPNVHVRV